MCAAKYEPISCEDEEIKEVVKTFEELTKTLEKLIGVREATLLTLHELKSEIEESYLKSRKARVAGTVATVSGSALNLVGFGLAFVTFGASLGFLIPGGILATAGGVTLAGAEIGYYVVSKSMLEAAEKACESDRKLMLELKSLGDKFEELLSSLTEKYKTKESLIERILVGKTAVTGFIKLCKFIDGFYDVLRTVKSAVVAARLGAGARTVWAGLSTTTRALGIIGAVCDVVFIPVDIAVMVKSSYDIHMHKQGKSNSTRAKSVQETIDELQAHYDKLIIMRDGMC